MVQKSGKRRGAAKSAAAELTAAPDAASAPAAVKRRGRPRAYQPELALAQAAALFRKDGLAATSLDDISAATGMNRPSLYGAFGDKRELYIKSYQRYRDDARAASMDIFKVAMPIRQRLARIYGVALDIYMAGDDGPLGCFTVMTAASAAVADPQIRAMVQDALAELDKTFARVFRQAQEQGELPATADPRTLAQLASATLHTLAVRSRAGTPRGELEALVTGAIDLMCPQA